MALVRRSACILNWAWWAHEYDGSTTQHPTDDMRAWMHQLASLASLRSCCVSALTAALSNGGCLLDVVGQIRRGQAIIVFETLPLDSCRSEFPQGPHWWPLSGRKAMTLLPFARCGY